MAITFGAETEFLSGANADPYYIVVAALGADKFVVAYTASGGGVGTAKVGTVSGTGITFGAGTTFATASNRGIFAAALSGTQFVIAYNDGTGSGPSRARVGTVSGGAIAFGAAATFITGLAAYNSVTALSGTQFVVAYNDASTGAAKVGTVSGDAIAFGAATTFQSGGTGAFSISAAALSATQFVVAYRDTADSNHGTAKVGTVSGTAIAFGAEAEFLPLNGADFTATAALSATQFVVAYRDTADSNHGTAKVGTVSGTAITFGAEAEFLSASGANYNSAAALDSTHFFVAYKDTADFNHGTAKIGTVSGTGITFGGEGEFAPGTGAAYLWAAALSAGKFVAAYWDSADSNHGTAKVGSTPVDAAISASDSVALADSAARAFSKGAPDSISLADDMVVSAGRAADDGVALADGVVVVWTPATTTTAPPATTTAPPAPPGAVGILWAGYVIFYHPLDSFTEYTRGQVWTGSGGFVPGKIGVPPTAVSAASVSLTAPTPGAYPTAVGKTRVAAAMWAKGLTGGSSTVTVERGYRIDMTATTISLGGTTAVWSGAGIADLMASLNNGAVWFLALDFENTAGTAWRLRTAIMVSGGVGPLAWVDQGVQTSGSQAVATTDTAPRLAIAAGEAGQWIDELVLWAGDKASFALFAPDELANLQDLADAFGQPMDQYEEYFGAPICWQATARMPDGSAWRDSGCGPCPPVVRVPRGASDVVVTDDGAAASPRIVEG